MKKIIPVVGIALIAVVVGVVAMSGSSKNESNTENNDMQSMSQSSNTSKDVMPKANEVIISNFAFGPEKMTVKKGTTVTWTNNDDARHDVTPDNPSENFKASDLLAKGESYSFTFNTAGSYSYKCSPHPYMKAVIEVVE